MTHTCPCPDHMTSLRQWAEWLAAIHYAADFRTDPLPPDDVMVELCEVYATDPSFEDREGAIYVVESEAAWVHPENR